MERDDQLVKPRALSVALTGLIWLSALSCASTKSQVVEQDISGPMPRPDRILVYNFAYSPSQVRLDRGLSAELVQAARGEPRTEQELAVGQKVSDVVAEHLVQEIRKMGLPAQRAAGHPAPFGNTVSIEGQFSRSTRAIARSAS